MNRLVVVTSGDAVDETVGYAVREARDAAQTRPIAVTVVVPVGTGLDTVDEAAVATIRDRVAAVADGERATNLVGGTETIRVDEESPAGLTERVVKWLPADTTRVVLGSTLAELTPARMADAVADSGRSDVTVERAPASRTVHRPPVALPGSTRRTVVTFLVAFGFYLVLGDATKLFDVVTGLTTAGLVALVLSRVAFESNPTLASAGRIARAVVYLPYLLVEVVRANLAVAWAVCHPRLPIDPRVVRVPAPEGRVEQALLANSITLTPGTLTVDVVDDELVVHTLTPGTRAALRDGVLARAVAFVVHGRGAGPTDRQGGG